MVPSYTKANGIQSELSMLFFLTPVAQYAIYDSWVVPFCVSVVGQVHELQGMNFAEDPFFGMYIFYDYVLLGK